MPAPMSSKPGNAPIKRQGHTASPKHGADPSARAHGRPEARDLKAK